MDLTVLKIDQMNIGMPPEKGVMTPEKLAWTISELPKLRTLSFKGNLEKERDPDADRRSNLWTWKVFKAIARLPCLECLRVPFMARQWFEGYACTLDWEWANRELKIDCWCHPNSAFFNHLDIQDRIAEFDQLLEKEDGPWYPELRELHTCTTEASFEALMASAPNLWVVDVGIEGPAAGFLYYASKDAKTRDCLYLTLGQQEYCL